MISINRPQVLKLNLPTNTTYHEPAKAGWIISIFGLKVRLPPWHVLRYVWKTERKIAISRAK